MPAVEVRLPEEGGAAPVGVPPSPSIVADLPAEPLPSAFDAWEASTPSLPEIVHPPADLAEPGEDGHPPIAPQPLETAESPAVPPAPVADLAAPEPQPEPAEPESPVATALEELPGAPEVPEPSTAEEAEAGDSNGPESAQAQPEAAAMLEQFEPPVVVESEPPAIAAAEPEPSPTVASAEPAEPSETSGSPESPGAPESLVDVPPAIIPSTLADLAGVPGAYVQPGTVAAPALSHPTPAVERPATLSPSIAQRSLNLPLTAPPTAPPAPLAPPAFIAAAGASPISNGTFIPTPDRPAAATGGARAVGGSPPQASASAFAQKPARPIVPGRAPLLADLPLDAPDDPPSWLVLIGDVVVLASFVLPWASANGIVLSTQGGSGYFDRWGLASLSDVALFVVALATLVAAIVPSRLPLRFRFGYLPLVFGGVLLGVDWIYLGLSFGYGVGIPVLLAGSILLIAGGGLTLRHGQPGPSV